MKTNNFIFYELLLYAFILELAYTLSLIMFLKSIDERFKLEYTRGPSRDDIKKWKNKIKDKKSKLLFILVEIIRIIFIIYAIFILFMMLFY